MAVEGLVLGFRLFVAAGMGSAENYVSVIVVLIFILL